MRRAATLLVVVVLLAIAGGLLLRRHVRTASHPSMTAFREYLANPASRMIVSSPEAPVLRDPTHRMMRQQLMKLREKFDGLSLYQCTPETPAIVEMAKQLGYKAVLLTVWDPRSEAELATASSVIRDDAGALALAVSIGSEGLMEQRYSFVDLQSARDELLERVVNGHTVEMTTTEPWWLYLKSENSGLREFGEFASINIHVVWDADIVNPSLAASWTKDRGNEVKAQLQRPVLIREAGFPGGGTSPREGVKLSFTRQMQADFWNAWIALGDHPPTVVFEGIDNPEKHWRDFEGTWGLLDTSLQPWPAWSSFAPLARAAQ